MSTYTKFFHLSFVSISIGIDQTGIRILQNVFNQTLPFLLLPLIVLVKLLIVV